VRGYDELPSARTKRAAANSALDPLRPDFSSGSVVGIELTGWMDARHDAR
jgi:hypothetical protein